MPLFPPTSTAPTFGSLAFETYSTPPPPRRSRRVARAVLAACLVCGLVAGAVIFVGRRDNEPRGGSTPSVVATTQPAPVLVRLCNDASGSVVKVDDLPKRTAAAMAAGLASWPATTSVKSTVARPAQAPLDLTMRVVQDNSFVSQVGPDLVTVRVPGFPGLSGEEPRTDDPEFSAKEERYVREVTAARNAVAAQAAEVTRGAAAVKALGLQSSTGSDVLGCVAAVTEGGGAVVQDILVASDFADTRLLEPNGSPRVFPGKNLSKARILLIQACPSGSPAECGALLSQFKQGLSLMGASPDSITVVRSEAAASAVATWWQTLKAKSLIPLR